MNSSYHINGHRVFESKAVERVKQRGKLRKKELLHELCLIKVLESVFRFVLYEEHPQKMGTCRFARDLQHLEKVFKVLGREKIFTSFIC